MYTWKSVPGLCVLLHIAVATVVSQLSSDACDGYCSVGYITQPVHEIPCNPYHPDYNQLRLGCSVYGPEGSQTEILWYRILDTAANTSTPELLTDSSEQVFVDSALLNGESPSTDSVLQLTTVREKYAGRYWCQVTINGSAEELETSQETVLRPPEWYSSLTSCPRRLYVTKPQCAEFVQASDSSSGSLPTYNTSYDSEERPLEEIIDNCQYLYLSQPPQQLPCNPYSTVYNDLRLECSVFASSNMSYTVQWLRQLDDLSSPQLLLEELSGINVYNTSHDNGVIRSRFTLFGVKAEDIGIYWCQILVTEMATNINESITTMLIQSAETVLDREESYSLCPPCPDVYLTSADVKCAELPLESVISPTVSHTPSVSLEPTPQPSLTLSERPVTSSEHEFPLWAYIAVPLGILLLVSLCIIICCVCLIRKHSGKRKATASTAKELTFQRSDSPSTNPSCTQCVPNAPVYDYPMKHKSVSRTSSDASSMGTYTAPNDMISFAKSNSTYQSLVGSTKEYTHIYNVTRENMTGPKGMELNGHLYTLPDTARMNPMTVYTLPTKQSFDVL